MDFDLSLCVVRASAVKLIVGSVFVVLFAIVAFLLRANHDSVEAQRQK